MVTGSQVHRKIKGQIRNVKREYDDASSQVKKLENELGDWEARRDQQYMDLAEIYLPEMEAGVISNTIPELREGIQRILESKNQRRLELAGLIQETTQRREGYQTQLEVVDTRLNDKVKEREEAEASIAEDLSGRRPERFLIRTISYL